MKEVTRGLMRRGDDLKVFFDLFCYLKLCPMTLRDQCERQKYINKINKYMLTWAWHVILVVECYLF